MKTPRRVRSFLLITFGVTWAIAGVGALFGVNVASPYYTIIAGTCMFGPAIGALIQWRMIERAPWSVVGLHPRSIKPKGLLVTTLLGTLIVPVSFLVIWLFGNILHMHAFGDVEVSGARFADSIMAMLQERGLPDTGGRDGMLNGLPGAVVLLVLLLAAVLASYTVNLPFMLGEELGWRGFLYHAMGTEAPLKRILFTGPVWGLWHAPLVLMGHNYPGYPWIGIGLMMVLCTCLALLFDWSRTRTNSVWGPCVLHGMINGSAGAFVLFARDGHVLVSSPAGAVGAIAVALLGTGVLLMDVPYRRAFLRGDRSVAAA